MNKKLVLVAFILSLAITGYSAQSGEVDMGQGRVIYYDEPNCAVGDCDTVIGSRFISKNQVNPVIVWVSYDGRKVESTKHTAMHASKPEKGHGHGYEVNYNVSIKAKQESK